MPREATLTGIIEKIESITIEQLYKNPEYLDNLFDLLETSAPLNESNIEAIAPLLREQIDQFSKRSKSLLCEIEVTPSWTLMKEGVTDIRDTIRNTLKNLLEISLQEGNDKKNSNDQIQFIHQQIMERIKRLLIIAIEKKLPTFTSNADIQFFDSFFNARNTAALRDNLLSDSTQITSLWKAIHLDNIQTLLRTGASSAASTHFYNALRVQDLQRLTLFHGPLKVLLTDEASFTVTSASEIIKKLPMDVVNSIDAYCLQTFFSIPSVFNNFSKLSAENNNAKNPIIKRLAERLELSTNNTHPLNQYDVIIRMQDDSRAFEELTKSLKPNEIRPLFATKDFEGMTIFTVLSNRSSPGARRTPEQHKKLQVHAIFLHLLDLHYYLLDKKPTIKSSTELDAKKKAELENDEKHYERQILNFDKFLHAVFSRFLQESRSPQGSLSGGDKSATTSLSDLSENLDEIMASVVADDPKISKNTKDAEYQAKRQILFDSIATIAQADKETLFCEAIERYTQYREMRQTRGLLPKETRFLNERHQAMTSEDSKDSEKYALSVKNNDHVSVTTSAGKTVSSLVHTTLSLMSSLRSATNNSNSQTTTPDKEKPKNGGIFNFYHTPTAPVLTTAYPIIPELVVQNPKIVASTGTTDTQDPVNTANNPQ